MGLWHLLQNERRSTGEVQALKKWHIHRDTTTLHFMKNNVNLEKNPFIKKKVLAAYYYYYEKERKRNLMSSMMIKNCFIML